MATPSRGCNALLALAALALVITESIARTLEKASGRSSIVNSQFSFFKYDKNLGWTHIPDISGEFNRREFSTTITTNSLGLREHELQPKQHFRVAVLGDSFAWGHGVEQSERFSDRLQALTGVETVNFGMVGYGPVQYYLQLPRVLATEPDLVILTFCLQNDFGDNVSSFRYGRYKPYAVLENGTLSIRGRPPYRLPRFGPQLHPWYQRYSALGRLFVRSLRVLRGGDFLPPADAPPLEGMSIADSDFYEQLDQLQNQKALGINAALLAGIKQRLDAAGVRLLLFAAPSKMELESTVAQNLLKAQAKDLDIPYFEMPEPLSVKDYYAIDLHWNPSGHAKVAEALAPVVQKIREEKEKKK
ncbi:MAG: hypothetical protein EBV03_02545 [Proteobacteria bacterium]|nr:hypothetical protein [Pseudomonadota bacterium]